MLERWSVSRRTSRRYVTSMYFCFFHVLKGSNAKCWRENVCTENISYHHYTHGVIEPCVSQLPRHKTIPSYHNTYMRSLYWNFHSSAVAQNLRFIHFLCLTNFKHAITYRITSGTSYRITAYVASASVPSDTFTTQTTSTRSPFFRRRTLIQHLPLSLSQSNLIVNSHLSASHTVRY